MEMTCGGTNIYYELSGHGERRVVLLHGWGCSTELMDPVAEILAQDMTVLTLDFPGHGKSGRPPEPWGVPEFADALLELLEKLDFLPCSVIAHSFGARVAICLASRDKSLFSRLVLTGAAGIRKPQTEEAKKRSEQFKKLRGLCEKARGMKIFGTLPDKMEEKLRQKYGSADYNALDEEMRKTFVKIVGLDLSDRLNQIVQPTLLIWGDKDDATPLWMGKKMEKEIPDAGLVVFEGGTHFAYLEQLPRFNKIVHHFLAEED